MKKFGFVIAGVLALLPAAAASAANVTFTGAVVNTCVLSVATPGALGMVADGTTLSSETSGGLNATVTVIAAGTSPTLSFSAPQLTGPAASTAGATVTLGYSSTGGALQALTSGTSVYTMVRLNDTLTVRARAQNADGFTNGVYNVASVVTCQQ